MVNVAFCQHNFNIHNVSDVLRFYLYQISFFSVLQCFYAYEVMVLF